MRTSRERSMGSDLNICVDFAIVLDQRTVECGDAGTNPCARAYPYVWK
jgi:hypothetical protein